MSQDLLIPRPRGFVFLMMLVLAACQPVDVEDSPDEPGEPGGNRAPVISGSPPQTVTAGAAYRFQPSASDADSDVLTFSITGRPGWAQFDAADGVLSGTPGAADVGRFDGITISVSDGSDSASLGPFAITVAAAQENRPPVISGNPPASVLVGDLYDFRPTASDADGDPLTFDVAGLPRWAEFDAGTARVFGTPTAADVGVYNDILIEVSDGTSTAMLGPFAITVAELALGSATLSWTPPTENSDGTPLSDLAGFRIYWGTSPDDYPNSVTISNPGITTYVVDNLVPGSYEFVSTAINADGRESAYSNPARKTIP